MTRGRRPIASLVLGSALCSIVAQAPSIVRAQGAPATARYREATEHTPESVRASRHQLDWSNKPELFRWYPGAETLPLPAPAPLRLDALDAIAESPARTSSREQSIDLDTLSTILFFTAGIIGVRPTSGGEIRATAAAGALYPNELYVVCGELPRLPAGLYHYNPRRERLTRLRSGDWRASLALAAADESIARNPATIVLSGILWRTAWKYRERGYRHLYWDGGMMLAHVLAVANALDVSARVLAAFIDDDVNRLIGANPAREHALALVVLGEASSPPANASPPAEVPKLPYRPNPLSQNPIDYPEAARYHAASALGDAVGVERQRSAELTLPERSGGTSARLALPAPGPARGDPGLGAVIRRRRSTRRFANATLPLQDLAAVVERPSHGGSIDFLRTAGSLLETYVILHAVRDAAPGVYRYQRKENALELLRPGTFRREAGFLSLGQALPRDASAVIYYFSDLNAVCRAFGERGYRYAELEAGLVAGRAYLAAYAVGRGATGLTFYDRETTAFFAPSAAGLDPLLVVAIGVPRRMGS